MTTILRRRLQPGHADPHPGRRRGARPGRVAGSRGGTAGLRVRARRSFAPDQIFGLNKRISKTIPAPAVVDSQALGKLYAAPVSLARSRPTPAPPTARTCGWRCTPCSASSARPPRSGSPPPNGSAQRQEAGGPVEAQGGPVEAQEADGGGVARPAHQVGHARRTRPQVAE